MRSISRFTRRFLFNTKVREGDFDWQGWADAVAMDYNQTEFDGDNYYWRV